jgi:protein-disulfide isomerase
MAAHVAWVVVSAVVLVLAAPGLFVAGFFTNELVSEEGGTAAVAQPSPSAPTPTARPTPSPTPVAVSVDDAPAWGPADAKVTVVEFGDYQ